MKSQIILVDLDFYPDLRWILSSIKYSANQEIIFYA